MGQLPGELLRLGDGAPDLVQEDVRQHEVGPGHQQPLAVLLELVPEEGDLEPHQPRVLRDVVNHRDGGRAVHQLASGGDGGERGAEIVNIIS